MGSSYKHTTLSTLKLYFNIMSRNWVSFEDSSSMDITWSHVNNGASVSSNCSSTSSSPLPSLSSTNSKYTAFDKIREEEQRGEYLGWSANILEGMQRAVADRSTISFVHTKKVTIPQNEYQKRNYGLGWSSEILEGGMTLKGA